MPSLLIDRALLRTLPPTTGILDRVEWTLAPTSDDEPVVEAPTAAKTKRKTTKWGTGGDMIHCSFCGKSQKQVKKLIAGPGVYICDECIDLCNDIIVEEMGHPEP